MNFYITIPTFLIVSVSTRISILYCNLCILLLIKFICYDDGCHLRKYASHPSRKDVTLTSQRLAKLEIVVDKLHMHMQGHTDKWCHANCDPYLFPELNAVGLDYTRVPTIL